MTMRVERLAKRYRSKHVVTDVTLELDNELVILLGPNGAGKSTLLRMLATIDRPTEGKFFFDSLEVSSRRSLRQVRSQIGYLPQSFGFPPNFTVEEFVCHLAWMRGMQSSSIPSAVAEVLAVVGLTSRAGIKMKKLSGGMVQRAGLAQALVASPRLLLLDEPTVGLDPEQRADLRDALRKVSGAIVVLSTHLCEDVAEIADRVLVMNEGRIAFDGTPAALSRIAPPGSRGVGAVESGYLAVVRPQLPSRCS